MSTPEIIFVFGSNVNGFHAGGAARYALDHYGAIWGAGYGLQGNAYAIPTMDHEMQTLSVDAIADHVAEFISFARERQQMSFLVTAIGCGIAGHDPADIGPLFAGVPENVFLSGKLTAALR
ncbi:MAG: hypothetical protein A3E01_09050 [Gammaproteobacteria bacterium RIFCSPHIGHO2_12_FULL_63_22]|nr:MAG: hypothetical protein A3E01_09050 [Gammaproteobacteria bacterium RIFCSPHIGHO2_12_FULL_63_22]